MNPAFNPALARMTPMRPGSVASPASYPYYPNVHAIPILVSKDEKMNGKYVFILSRTGNMLLVQAPPQEGAPDGMGPMWVTIHQDVPNAFAGC